ncbi:peptide methionine sulfoxide [Xylariomycetidae sp. FL0641]|nr:peptide methionine sulfoxide [Xylariomycetidae sp. FL0641]
MAAAFAGMPNFITRFFRPLTSSARLGISSDTGSGAGRVAIPDGAEKATIAAGCFWGVEHMYRKHFGGKGLYDARVGYVGGDVRNPTYRAVCTGKTGHTEGLQLHYDPSRITYRQILEFFYRMHDPTTADRQGPDVGSQYRSAIFPHDAEQARVAREVTDQASAQWYGGKVVTQIVPAFEGDDDVQWWDAEDYHQLYLDKNPAGYECPSHFLRSFEPLK